MRAREAGRAIAYVAAARFAHYEGASAGRFDREAQNERRFYARWFAMMGTLPRVARGEVGAIALRSAAGSNPLAARRLCRSRRGVALFRTSGRTRRDRAVAAHRPPLSSRGDAGLVLRRRNGAAHYGVASRRRAAGHPNARRRQTWKCRGFLARLRGACAIFRCARRAISLVRRSRSPAAREPRTSSISPVSMHRSYP